MNRLFTLGLSCCLLYGGHAQALNKCVDASGRVSFQDGPYPTAPDSKPASTRVSGDPVLHVIGVYEGNDPYDDGKPWQQKCGDGEDRAVCRKRLKALERERGGVVFVDVFITDREAG